MHFQGGFLTLYWHPKDEHGYVLIRFQVSTHQPLRFDTRPIRI